MAHPDRLSGNEAVAVAMRQIDPDVMGAFPITPSTEIPQYFAQYVADGAVHTELVTVESEHSSMSVCMGAAAAGGRAVSATSSAGMALMYELLYVAASCRLPIVLAVSTRALSGPININNDHSDAMGARDAGWIQIYAENNQEAYDNYVQAFPIAETADVRLPVMICQDGFITSHAVENIELLEDEEVKGFVGEYDPMHYLLNSREPLAVGPYDVTNYYMEHKKQQAEAMKNAKAAILEQAKRFEELTGRKYGFFEEYRMEDAEEAVVVIGSTAGTAKATVDVLRAEARRVGLVKIRVFRPRASLPVAAPCLLKPEALCTTWNSGRSLSTSFTAWVAGTCPQKILPGSTTGSGTFRRPAMSAKSIPIWASGRCSNMAYQFKKELEKPERFVGGHRLCAGCGAGITCRAVMRALEPEDRAVITNATGCLEVSSFMYPYTSWTESYIHTAFENAAATCSGVEACYEALKRRGKVQDNFKFITFGGDGGTYDIGFQSLSGAMERGHDMVYVCYDNEAYMNTGIQRSSSTPRFANATTAPVGREKQGKQQDKKDLTAIMVAHGIPYAAQTTFIGNFRDLHEKAKKAIYTYGPCFLNVLSPCPRGWQYETALLPTITQLAVDTCLWPMYEVEEGVWHLTYEPKKKKPIEDYMRLQGRFKHCFKPGNEWMLESAQNYVDEKWEQLLEKCR